MNALSLNFLAPYRQFAPVIMRLVLGAIFALNGWNKLQGIEGFAGMLGTWGIPGASTGLAYFVALVELLGGIAMILGLFTRLFGFLLAIVMLTAIIFVHIPNGFLGEGGYAYPLALFGLASAMALLGGGKMGLDDMMGWNTD